MYHSVIGKRLVEYVNERDGTAHTVRSFFDDTYAPLFFGDSRLLQNVNNSPFDQAITKQKKPFTEQLYADCLAQVHRKVETQAPDASFFLGGPAAGNTETTSGQVTAMNIAVASDEIYASWIGAALGLTVQGGLILLVDAKDVLLATYDGWAEYRKHLEQMPTLKPLQINAWNGQWVAGKFQEDDLGPFSPDTNKDHTALETQNWIHLLFALSYHYREGPVNRLLAYVYSLGQSNTTVGFVQMNLLEVNSLYDLYKKYFTVPEGMHEASFTNLYETAESFRFACTRTEIGLRALRPKDVFKAETSVPTPPTQADKQVAFDTYQTWIIAMLNNTELLTRARNLANALYNFQKEVTRMKTEKPRLVEEVLKKRYKQAFIEGLTEILKEDEGLYATFKQTVEDLLTLSPENVSLFITLLRFEYAGARGKP